MDLGNLLKVDITIGSALKVPQAPSITSAFSYLGSVMVIEEALKSSVGGDNHADWAEFASQEVQPIDIIRCPGITLNGATSVNISDDPPKVGRSIYL